MWYLAASLRHAAERFSVPSPAPIQAICWAVMCATERGSRGVQAS